MRPERYDMQPINPAPTVVQTSRKSGRLTREASTQIVEWVVCGLLSDRPHSSPPSFSNHYYNFTFFEFGLGTKRNPTKRPQNLG